MTPIKLEGGQTTMPDEKIDSPDGSIGEPVGGDSIGEPVGGDGMKKGPWTSIEDSILMDYVTKHGEGNWNNVQKYSGLSRCGKSCRLRWANHLRPNLKKGTITPEEERMIIRLHYQMGNKWARMAAQLHGRTDNEIKNFWNTRAKRCERTGQPLHPPEICHGPSNDYLQNPDVNGFGIIDRDYTEVSQGSPYVSIPDIRFDNYKPNPGILPYVSYCPHISTSSQGYGSKGTGFVDPSGFHGSLYGGVPTCEAVTTWSLENTNQPFALASSSGPESSIKNLTLFETAVSGSHALSNGNFSASSPLTGTAELEPPSFQNPDTEISNWLTCPSSPQAEAVDSYIPPVEINSGLLEAVIPQGLNGTKKRRWSSSNDFVDGLVHNHSEASWGDHGDPVTPLGHTSDSVFSGTPPFSTCSSDEFLSQATSGSEFMLANSKPVLAPTLDELDGSSHPEFLRPDALLGSNWNEGIYGGGKSCYMLNDVIQTMLAQRASSTPAPGPGSDTSPSNNMPPLDQSSGPP